MTSQLDLPALRLLFEKATKGEWHVEMGGWRQDCPHIMAGTQLVALLDAHENDRPTAEAIVALHNQFPVLLDRLQRLEAVAEAARNVRNANSLGATAIVGAMEGKPDTKIRFEYEATIGCAIDQLILSLEALDGKG